MLATERLELSEVEEGELRRRAGQYTRPYREVIRAKIVLLAAEGLSDVEIAARVDCTDRMVAKWRRRFEQEGVAVRLPFCEEPGLNEQHSLLLLEVGERTPPAHVSLAGASRLVRAAIGWRVLR